VKNPLGFSWRNMNIRDKLLSFYAAMILCIIAINLTMSMTAFRYIEVFDDKLTVYFDIQEFRMFLVENQSMLERSLRERVGTDQANYFSSIPALWQRYQRMQLRAQTSLEARFQLRAIERGLTEYFRRAGKAVRMRDSGDPDYYLHFLDTRRIYDYVMSYTDNLMNANLNDGSRAYAVLAARAEHVRTISFVSIAVVGAAFILFGLIFSNSVSRPIHHLAELSSRIAAGDLEVGTIPVSGADEVGVLSSSFNSMSRSIREMVEGLKEKAELERKLHEEEIVLERTQRSLQEARFMGLQAQINPHFLFNALNTISRTALFEGAEGTSGLIKSLATLFRYHLRDPRKSVLFSEELLILEEYLSIQRYRYGDRLRYSVNCAIPADELRVPAFILQPLVENAVKYGIEPKEEGGEVTVEAVRQDHMIRVTVSDTGLGMSREEAADILTAAREGRGGIGIANVLERLNLYFDGREEVEFVSESGVGTAVILRFPARFEGVEECTPS
jgi:sensor histidine kinase YesM